ncbi:MULTISPECIES: TonB-dependent receptor plug domain-containing protein [Cyanophyceae]|uniref:AMIN domain-containing protein n=1 Tax=Cyanophyceae TaxID=3028117 RepID=UPI00117FC86D|nr:MULTISPECIES: TonB-dependent receptor plug domain-containing protein [Cyanophyceae]
MKRTLLSHMLVAGIAPVVATAPVFAQVNTVIDIRVLTTDFGLEVILDTSDNVPLEAAIVKEGNSIIATIPNAQLSRSTFREVDPILGITEITALNLDPNTLQVTITGDTNAPQAEIVQSPQGLSLNVVTAMAETEDLEVIELVVTATRTEEDPLDIPRSITVINRQQIEAQSAVSNNTADIISRFVPGLGAPNLSNRANAQTLRGRDFSVLIDGIPQRSNRSPNIQLEYIDPDQIERIEVVSGPTAIYGAEALGG